MAVGPAGVGKTTLSARLLFDGVHLQGDESVVLRDGRAVAVARPLHLKPGVEDLVPELRPVLASLPFLDGDPPIRAFDPTVAGLAWTLDEAPVDEVLVLERAVDADSALEPMAATEAMPEIIAQVFRNQEPTSAVMAQVAGVLRVARCWRFVGQLRSPSARSAAGPTDSCPHSDQRP